VNLSNGIILPIGRYYAYYLKNKEHIPIVGSSVSCVSYVQDIFASNFTGLSNVGKFTCSA
jgi:hypothetical protein